MAIPAKGKVRVKKSWGLIAAKAMQGYHKQLKGVGIFKTSYICV
jgi:hypothetical protein